MPTVRAACLRLAGAVGTAVLLVAATSGPASAHVTVTPSSAAAGSYSVLRFDIPHGCDGSPTTKVVISMPDDVIEATPTRNPFYRVSKQTARLDEPITSEDGAEITKKVATVTYTARTPLPDGYRDALEIEVQVPDRAGDLLQFPTIQSCEHGRTAWTEVPASGQDLESLDHPAPGFVIQAASSQAPVTADQPEQAGDGSDPWPWLGVALGAVGIVLGGAALARTRGRA